MAKIIIGTADGKKIGFDLDILLTTRLLIQANSGAGKSYLLRKLMEELFKHVQVIGIDPEGEFATLREKYDYVLVGKGGETPVHVSTASEVALKLLELRASAVCDLYETPARERHAWVRTFLDALMNAPKKLWHPLIVVVDEAHIFCPEEGDSEAADAMIDLTTRGRKRGFCAVWATQRLAKLDKDAAAELQNKLIGGTFLDVDIKRAAKDLGIPTGKEEREFGAHIKVVSPGTFIALGRAISKQRIELQVGQVQTSHPQSGSAKHAAGPPPAPAKVKALLPQLADLPKVAEEKARTVKEFQARIRELTNELAQAKRAQTKTPQTIADPSSAQEMRQIRAGLLSSQKDYERLKAVCEAMMKVLIKVSAQGFDDVKVNPEDLKAAFDQAAQQVAQIAKKKIGARLAEIEAVKKEVPSLQKQLSRLLESESKPMTIAVDVKHNKPFTVTPIPARPRSAPMNGNGELSSSQFRILSALSEAVALGRKQVNRVFLAALAGVSSTSGGFRNNLGALRSAGMIDYPQPEFVAMTEEGRGKAPEADPPASADEMLERCKSLFSSSQAAILDALAKSFPDAMPREELAAATGASETSGGFRNNLGSLRTAGMIDYPEQGKVKLSNWVMLEE